MVRDMDILKSLGLGKLSNELGVRKDCMIGVRVSYDNKIF